MPPSTNTTADLLLESLNQISNTAISPRRTGGELEDSAMAAFIDQLNLSEAEIYIGLKEVRERAQGKGIRQSDIRKQRQAQFHQQLTENLKQVLEHGEAPIAGEATIFIKHPLGTNNWPEFALYHNGRVLPIEVKSSKNGKIVWNGGLPREGCLYIYFFTKNKAEGRRSTIFFGEDVIDGDVYKKLRDNHAKVQDYAKYLHAQAFPDGNDMGFSEYARAMFNHSVCIHQHPMTSVWQAHAKLRIAEWAGAEKALLKELRVNWIREKDLVEQKQDAVAAQPVVAKKRSLGR